MANNKEQDLAELQEATDLYNKGGIQITRYAAGKGKLGVQVSVGYKNYIQLTEPQMKQLASALPTVQKKLRQGLKESKNEELKGDQHKIDHNKDGKITGDDFKGLRKKKNKQETGKVNPKLGEKKMSESTKIRERLMSIWEKAGDKHTKGAVPSEPHGQYDSPGGKKMKADMKADGNPDVNDTEKMSHDDAAKAGRAGPNAKKRPNDGKIGDNKIINQIAKTYKEMKSGN